MSNAVYSDLNRMVRKDLHSTGSVGDHEGLIESNKNNDNAALQKTTLVNNNSVTSFKIEENQVSVTRSMGRRYSTMCFQASPCKTKIDITVTQGNLKPEPETEVFDLNRVNVFVSQNKLPGPPLAVKLCLGFILLLVFAMTIALIVVMTMPYNGETVTIPSSQQVNQSYIGMILENSTMITFQNGTGINGNYNKYNNKSSSAGRFLSSDATA